MRNLRCCLAVTALALSVTSCQKEPKPVRYPTAPPQDYSPMEEMPDEQPMEQMPPEQARPSERPGRMQPGPRVMRTTHDLVVDALVCGLPPASIGAMVGPRGGGPSMSSGEGRMSMQARCNALAPNLSAEQFSQLDHASVTEVREAIERRAVEERLDDVARMQMLGLFDRGIEAEREAMEALQVGDRFSIVGAMPTTSSAPPSRRIHAEIEPSDLATLSARDSLNDLLLFARASGSGALATEAEALAWVLATDRFLQTESLAPPLRVFAAEPLFESMLGVPTPQQAQSLDANRVTRQVWNQYLETAVQAVEMMPSPGRAQQQQPQGMAPTPEQARPMSPMMRPRGPIGGGRDEAMPGGPAMSQEEQEKMKRIVDRVSQRMDALSRRMPASDLRMTLDSYAAELRSLPIGIGGGPEESPQREQPMPSEEPPMLPPQGPESQ